MAAKTAVTPTRADDYPGWYQAVIRAADMAENAPVRGCMTIKPWGYGIWERVRDELDQRIKDTGHDNCYFPLFIPMRFIKKEAEHVEGFAKEMAVVTHHRLSNVDGELTLDGELEEPLIVRPTSETIIGEAMADWIRSYRDLPLLLNQWANVVRWEMRPRIFLRTSEFLWQEGHTAHATDEEAMAETEQNLETYRQVVEDLMAIPVIRGRKSESERFPGAKETLTIEAMMQDGKALQAGTSHHLGQSFAKAANIRYQDKDGGLQHVWTTSFGASTRLIGALIMTHGDDNGLQLPPRIAPTQVVIVPVLRGDEGDAPVLEACQSLAGQLRAVAYEDQKVRVKVDARDMPGPDKRWEWIKKGVPLLVEIGPRDIEKGGCAVIRRDQLDAKKTFPPISALVEGVAGLLAEIQDGLFARALAYRDSMLRTDVTDWESFKAHFEGEGTGFVRASWCNTLESETRLKELGVTVRCLPLDQGDLTGKACVLTGAPAAVEAVFAKAY